MYVAFIDFVLSVPNACFYWVVDSFKQVVHLELQALFHFFQMYSHEIVGSVYNSLVNPLFAKSFPLFDRLHYIRAELVCRLLHYFFKAISVEVIGRHDWKYHCGYKKDRLRWLECVRRLYCCYIFGAFGLFRFERPVCCWVVGVFVLKRQLHSQ